MPNDSDLTDYDPTAFPPFAVTVDIVVFTIRGDQLQVLLVERAEPPFKGDWALPGGFVRMDEGLADAARRELAEETGIEAGPRHLAELGAYGDPNRDPRMRVVTNAWWAIMPHMNEPTGGSDAALADLVDVDDVLKDRVSLAFDHQQILTDALEKLRSELETTTLASSFWTDEFRISDLRRVYEIVWGRELDPGNFHRKVTKIQGWLEPTGNRSAGSAGGRPAELFRSAAAIRPLDVPLRREQVHRDQ